MLILHCPVCPPPCSYNYLTSEKVRACPPLPPACPRNWLACPPPPDALCLPAWLPLALTPMMLPSRLPRLMTPMPPLLQGCQGCQG